MDKNEAYTRFRQAIDYLKDKGQVHKQQDIADAIGISKSYLSDVMKDRGGKFSETFLKRFASTYSDYINSEWLIHGYGLMSPPSKNQRPHLDARASAGFMAAVSQAEMVDEADLAELNDFTGEYDFTIEVSGESMSPDFQPGDIVLARLLRDSSRPPVGRICILDTMDGALLKEVAGIKGNALVLHSLNPDYEDFEVEFQSILRIALVVASVRNYD